MSAHFLPAPPPPNPRPELWPIARVSRFIHHPANFCRALRGRDKQISLGETTLDTGMKDGKAVSALGDPKRGP